MTRQLDTAIPDTAQSDAIRAREPKITTQPTPHTPRQGVHKYTLSSVCDLIDASPLACAVLAVVSGLLLGKVVGWAIIVGQAKVGR